jgi:hypothetical protein
MNCPHCGISIEIEQVNCAIFRCGIIKSTGEQIPPHLPEKECISLVPYIWGCSKPFKLVDGVLIKCEYI